MRRKTIVLYDLLTCQPNQSLLDTFLRTVTLFNLFYLSYYINEEIFG